jgi:hypothetical protein
MRGTQILPQKWSLRDQRTLLVEAIYYFRIFLVIVMKLLFKIFIEQVIPIRINTINQGKFLHS